MILKVLSVILLLYLMPCCVGSRVNHVLKINTTVVKNYLVGNVFIWALFQLVTVPLVLAKQSFLIVVAIVSIVLFGMCIFEIYHEVYRKKCVIFKRKYWSKRIPKMNTSDMISMVIMEVMLLALLFTIVMLQHTDADDARFVVNAVEIVRTNRMFLTDVITGQELEIWIGELVKDVTSPWAVYIAYFAKLTGIPVVIMAHSVLPISLILCAFAVYWLFAGEVFKKNLTDKSMFMCLMILLNVYGYFSRRTAEMFLMTRIWQGKAVVASVAIPAMFLFAMWLYRNEKKIGYYVLVAMLGVGMCLMSGMGIIIGAIMLAGIGLVYGIAKRKWWMTLVIWALCIPNVVYFVINEMQPDIWILE